MHSRDCLFLLQTCNYTLQTLGIKRGERSHWQLLSSIAWDLNWEKTGKKSVSVFCTSIPHGRLQPQFIGGDGWMDVSLPRDVRASAVPTSAIKGKVTLAHVVNLYPSLTCHTTLSSLQLPVIIYRRFTISFCGW